MKRTFITLLAAFTGIGAFAAESNDTIIVDMKKADRVIISENDSTLHVRIKGCAGNSSYLFDYTRSVEGQNSSLYINERAERWDFTTPFSKKKDKKSSSSHELCTGGLYFGFVTGIGAPANVDIDMSASYEIGTDLLTLSTLSKNKRHDFSIGFGLDWRNYRMTGHERFVKLEDGSIGTGAYPEGADIKFSRLKTFSLTFPLRYTYGVTKHLSVSAAAILSINTYGSLKTRYRLEGNKQRELDKNIHQRPVSVDLQAGVNWKWIGFYVKYSPVSVLNTAFGPDFKPLSTGIELFF